MSNISGHIVGDVSIGTGDSPDTEIHGSQPDDSAIAGVLVTIGSGLFANLWRHLP